jgi:hypothetical protein
MPDWERKYMGRWKMPNDDYIKQSDAVSAFCGNCEGTEVCGQLGEPCEEVKRIKAIPAADVEPVKHGYWYFRGGRPCCSVCNTKALWKDEGGTGGFSHEYVGAKSKRCPECGARMDKEVYDA